MRKTALKQLIDWMEEQNEPSMYQGAIYKATELLETEQEQIEKAYDEGFGKFKSSKQYYKDTYE